MSDKYLPSFKVCSDVFDVFMVNYTIYKAQCTFRASEEYYTTFIVENFNRVNMINLQGVKKPNVGLKCCSTS